MLGWRAILRLFLLFNPLLVFRGCESLLGVFIRAQYGPLFFADQRVEAARVVNEIVEVSAANLADIHCHSIDLVTDRCRFYLSGCGVSRCHEYLAHLSHIFLDVAYGLQLLELLNEVSDLFN